MPFLAAEWDNVFPLCITQFVTLEFSGNASSRQYFSSVFPGVVIIAPLYHWKAGNFLSLVKEARKFVKHFKFITLSASAAENWLLNLSFYTCVFERHAGGRECCVSYLASIHNARKATIITAIIVIYCVRSDRERNVNEYSGKVAALPTGNETMF